MLRDGGAEPIPGITLRRGTPADVDACLAVWVGACAARDGVAVAGVAERALPNFASPSSMFVADDGQSGVAGFVLATAPGSGRPAGPPGAEMVALLAVGTAFQGRGLGMRLLEASTGDAARRGRTTAALHVLADNHAAVALYAAAGWRPWGEQFEHSLLRRPCATYVKDLAHSA